MPISYFITNDLRRANTPSNVYCYMRGKIGCGRYQWASNEAEAHRWWLYSTEMAVAHALAPYSRATDFAIGSGRLGNKHITIARAGGVLPYRLSWPKEGNVAVALVPGVGGGLRLGHIGHTICPDHMYRPRGEGSVYALQEGLMLAGAAYGHLMLA